MAVKYQGTSYEDWYKTHYGNENYKAPTKPTEMSDADYQIGQALYKSYLENTRLDSEYGRATDTLAQNKKDAEIAADVTLQRMQKYLPQQLAKQGLYGTGVSEDAYLKLQNQYQKDISEIGKTYSTNMTDLENAYQQNKNAVWEQANEGVNTAVANVGTNQQVAYDEAYAALDPTVLTSEDDVDTVLKSYKSAVSNAQYQNLNRYAQTLKDDIAEVKKNTPSYRASFTRATNNNLVKGTNITITISNGSSPTAIELESNGEAPETSDVISYAANIGDNEAFAYHGEIYLKKNGKVYSLKSKSGLEGDRKSYNTLKHYLNHGLDKAGNIYNATA